MSQQLETQIVPKPNRTIPIAIASISAIFVIFVVILWAAGFFRFSGSDPSSKIVAAALALVGGLVAAIVSIVGILLKYSIDQRTESRLQIESARAAAERKAEADRASALQGQAEQRLSLEAAIRAVELLGATEGSAGALQRAGALFALANLDQHQLTLDLSSYLLKSGALEPSMACSLIDRALKNGDENIRQLAVTVLYDNAERLVTESDTELPSAIGDWDECLNSKYVREWAVFVITKVLLARPFLVWKQVQFRSTANALIGSLALAWESDPDAEHKDEVGAILKNVLAGFPQLGALNLPTKLMDMGQVASQVAESNATSSVGMEIVKQIESWRSGSPQPKDAAKLTASTSVTEKPDTGGMHLLYLSVSNK